MQLRYQHFLGRVYILIFIDDEMPKFSNRMCRLRGSGLQGLQHEADHHRKVDVLILIKTCTETLQRISEYSIMLNDAGNIKHLVVQYLPSIGNLPYDLEIANLLAVAVSQVVKPKLGIT